MREMSWDGVRVILSLWCLYGVRHGVVYVLVLG